MGNWFFQDVLPILSSDGVPRGLLPFPPLPAVILLPFVAAFGLATDDQLLFTTLAAIDVGMCWWMLGRLRIDAAVRLATTLFFAFGTTFWYAAQLATTWYQAHIVAVGLTMLAVGLALRADPAAQDDEPAFDDPDEDVAPRRRPRTARPLDRLRVDPRQLVAGLLFGLAATARLTVVVAAPFFMLVGSGGSWWRRSWSAGLGALDPGRAPAGLQRGHDRPGPAPGLRLPVSPRDGGVHGPRLRADVGGRGPALPAPQRRDHVPHRPGPVPDRAARLARGARRPGVHGARRRSAACSTCAARWPCPATSG